jgi:hypothetical protein
MKSIHETRNEVVELVRRGRKTVQQDDSRLRRVPGLTIEEPKAHNIGGLEVHRRLRTQLLYYFLTARAELQSERGLARSGYSASILS